MAATAVLASIAAACSLGVDFDRFAVDTPVGADGADSDRPDTATDSGGPLGPFCRSLNPQPTICSDFDEVPFLAGWQEPTTRSPAEGGIDPSVARSLPNAFVAKSKACDGGSCTPGSAYIRRQVGKFDEWTVSFDLYLETDPKGNATNGPIVTTLDYSNDYVIQLVLSTLDSILLEKLDLSDGGTVVVPRKFDFKKVGVGQWRRVELRLTPTDGGSSLSLYVDGAEVLVNQPAFAHQFANVSPSLFLGVYAIGQPCDDWTVRVDNVVFDGR